MPSAKKLIGKKCVYCGRRPAVTWDHVFARSFFPPFGDFREGIPQVQACAECNTRKSAWENMILPFIQLSGDSLASTAVVASSRVGRSLSHNTSLAIEIREGFFTTEVRTFSRIYYQITGFELSDATIRAFSDWHSSLARALYFIYTKTVSEPIWKVFVINPSSLKIQKYMADLMSSTANNISMSKTDSGWRVLMVLSEDGIFATEIEMNGIIKQVYTIKDKYSEILPILKAVSY